MSCNIGRNDQGASLVEFAFAIPILFMLVIGIMDVSRYYLTKTMLEAGAQDGVIEAQTMYDFYWDVHTLPTTHPYRLAFNEGRKRIIEAATKIPLGSWVSDPETPSAVQLIAFDMQDYEVPGGDTSLRLKGAAVLRPYECATVIGGDPFVCSVSDKNCVTHSQVKGTCPVGISDSERLMKTHEIAVVMRAKLEFFTPFLDPVVVEGMALGNREDIPHGREVTLPIGGTVTTTTSTSTTTTVTSSTTTTTVVGPCDVDGSWAECVRAAPGSGAPICPDWSNPPPPNPFNPAAPRLCPCIVCPPPLGI